MHMTETLHFTGLRGELRRGEPLARHTSWRVGGPVDRLYVPSDLDDLSNFLRQLPESEPVYFIGLGSNLLVRDAGVRGTVVLTHTAAKRPVLASTAAGPGVYAEAGVASPKVARFAAMHDLAGAEFLAGIPGSVGGALAMNAGCYGGETWSIVARVATIDRSGTLHVRGAADFDTGYRHCALRGGSNQNRLGENEWFAAAWFALPAGDGREARSRITQLLARRIASQPLGLPNAGSVFRNPPGGHAAQLIEACGLKGLAHGAARVSEKHANFIVNPKGAARAADIEWLIAHVRETVRARTGIDLHPEVRVIGEAA
jgi:UDP-N-acetylmuramate dehydrogenase